MPAEDGDPVVSEAEHEAWHEWRVTYVVTLEATPFKVAGTLLLLPSQDPFLLTELGTTLFLPVFSPTVEVGEVTLTTFGTMRSWSIDRIFDGSATRRGISGRATAASQEPTPGSGRALSRPRPDSYRAADPLRVALV